MKPQWTKQQVPVKNRTGIVFVDGEVLSGLAVHKDLILDGPETRDNYTITHFASGLNVAAMPDYRRAGIRNTKKLAEKLLPLADWTRDERTVVMALRENPVKVRDLIEAS